MNVKRFILLIITGFLMSPGIILAQHITVTQIDPSNLLTTSRIDSFLSITDEDGEPLELDDMDSIILEHETEKGMRLVEILDIQRSGISDETITFLFVLDNSGSMYDPVGDGSAGYRMDHAVRAVKEFLATMDTSSARAGLAVFNTRYTLLAEPGMNMEALEEALARIEEPSTNEAYTELYWTVGRAAADLARFRGRKAVVLLSDGENYPYFANSGNPHPEFGETLHQPEDGLVHLEREGVTLYGINFAPEKDPSLSSISVESGGTMYDAGTDEELTDVYGKIRERIEKEYRVTLRAPITFLKTPSVRASYGGVNDTRIYYAVPLMSGPGDEHFLLLLLILLAALAVWVLLVIIRFEKPASGAEISMLRMGPGKPFQRTIALTENRTVIGGSAYADFTVAGIPDLKDNHATIIRNEKTGAFTVSSEEEIRVNNRMTKKRELKPGDVINVEGATIVFDEPREDQ